MSKKDKKKEKKRAKKLAKQQPAVQDSQPVTPPLMVFYDKQFIETIITVGDLPEDIVDAFAQAVKDCKPYEDAGLRPIIGYCADPQRVIVTSIEKLEGLFIQ